MPAHGRNTRAWQAARARVLKTAQHCAICGHFLDHTIKTPDPLSPEVDHIVPLAKGGPLLDVQNLRAVHRICNLKRNAKRARPRAEQRRQSRQW